MPESEKSKATTNINIELRDISVRDNNVLNALAKLRGVTKWKIIQEACEEYVKNHMGDIPELMKTKGELPSAKAVLESGQ